MRRLHLLLLPLALVACATPEVGASRQEPSVAAAGAHWSEDERIAESLYTLSALTVLAASSEGPAAEREALLPRGLWFEANPVLAARYPLRERLAALPALDVEGALSRDARSFFVAHPHYSTEYAREVLEKLGPAPGFAVRAPLRFAEPDRDLALAAQELSGLLQRAWALIGPRWIEDAPAWRAAQLPAAAVGELQQRTLGWLGYRGAGFDFGVVVYPTLFEANGMGVTLAEDRRLLLVGPTQDDVAARVLVVHEFMHHPVDRAALDGGVQRAIERSACAFPGVTINAGYTSWASYFFETFIRAASPRVVQAANPFRAFDFHDLITERLQGIEQQPERRLEETLIEIADAIAATCAPPNN